MLSWDIYHGLQECDMAVFGKPLVSGGRIAVKDMRRRKECEEE